MAQTTQGRLFEGDQDSINFTILVNKIAESEDLNNIILMIMSRAEIDSLPFLFKLSKVIAAKLKDRHPEFEDKVIQDFAECISGLRYYRARYQMEYIKKRLPHLAKWCIASMAQTKITDAMLMDGAIKQEVKKIVAEFQEEHPDQEQMINKLMLLEKIALIANKNNPIVEKAVCKHHFGEKDLKIEEILAAFKDKEAAP
jgi:hypothetical protein